MRGGEDRTGEEGGCEEEGRGRDVYDRGEVRGGRRREEKRGGEMGRGEERRGWNRRRGESESNKREWE